MDITEFMGRALVAAAGLTPRARRDLMLQHSFRGGGPRVLAKTDLSRDRMPDFTTRQQPLPERAKGLMTMEERLGQPY